MRKTVRIPSDLELIKRSSDLVLFDEQSVNVSYDIERLCYTIHIMEEAPVDIILPSIKKGAVEARRLRNNCVKGVLQHIGVAVSEVQDGDKTYLMVEL